jgi:hypothetical protein
MGWLFKDEEKPYTGSMRPMGSAGDTNKVLARKLAKRGRRDKRDIDEGEVFEGTKKFSFWD